MDSKFPSNFYFGAATSAHQAEGENDNDWAEWELLSAPRLAKEATLRQDQGKWPDYILNPPAGGPDPLEAANYISGKATDHYNRYEEDFDIAKRLGHNAHRFSIEWSRIEPKEGVWDEKEIEHYRKIILALRKRKIEPFVTLWHWTLPLWLAKQGGVQNKNFPKYFERYAEKMAAEFKNDVRFWLTINEPEIYTLNSYFRGRRPPQKTGVVNFYRALAGLMAAHRTAYRAIKKISPSSTVGVVCNLSDFKSSGGPINAVLKIFFERSWNRHFLNRIKDDLDIVGLNFYFHYRINYGLNKNTNEVISDVGWDLHPEGIYSVLSDVKTYKKPVIIAESGLADSRDKYRAWFIKETLRAVRQAMNEGADVRGYFHWSLTDNFEWDKGFWPRFGLVEIDYRTFARKIRPSAFEYKKMIENGL